MNLLTATVAPELALLGWLILLPSVAAVLWSLRRGFLPDGTQQHLWLAGIVCLSCLWTLQVRTGDGLHFGMLGAALYALIFGPARAIVGLLAALLLYLALNGGAWVNFGVDGVLLALLPGVLAGLLQQAIGRWLPKNVFVFIIGNGLFVTLAVTAATSLLLLLMSLTAAPPAAMLRLPDYVGVSLLMAWGEAVVSGMLFSSLVIFLPRAVLTYSEDQYLPRRKR